MKERLQGVLEQYEQQIIGQEENLRLLLTAILSRGHVLLEGVPGTGKTQMVRSLASLINGDFRRIQFTPDLLPSDITGSTIYNLQEGSFETIKGPIFTNILLADEINRTPAKTQAALLEAMEEKQVTIQGKTYPLADVFFVVATQNPIEYEGTYPLPEAQQDRFLFKLIIDFPEFDEEQTIVKKVISNTLIPKEITFSLTLEEFVQIREEISQITLTDDVLHYITSIVRQTREDDGVRYGASTRAAISIGKAAQAWAYLSGRDYVSPDDVKIVVKPALRHRIQLTPNLELEGRTVDQVIEEIVGSVAVPR